MCGAKINYDMENIVEMLNWNNNYHGLIDDNFAVDIF